VLVNLIDFGMNVQEAGDAARVRHVGSAEPTGKPSSAIVASLMPDSTGAIKSSVPRAATAAIKAS
jgi:hypothetical protein